MKNWPLANYPIFVAIILLILTATSFYMGYKYLTDYFVKTAYYFIICGVILNIYEILSGYINRDIIKNILAPIKEFYDFIRDFIRRHNIIIIYLSISLLISSNFDKNYLMLLDTTFPIKHSFENFYFWASIYEGNLFYSVMELNSSWISQRIYLISIIFFSGYSIYSLFRKFSQSRIAQLYTGLLYMINPFTYVRIISGQWLLLLSYATLPLLLKAFLDLLEKNEKKEIIKFVIYLSIISFSFHIFLIALITICIIFIFWFNKFRNIMISRILLFIVILFIILNFYWILPVTTSRDTIINNIGNKDFDVFAPNIESMEGLFNIAAMYGFWKEYTYAKDFIPYWQILYIFILSLAIVGYISFYKDRKIGIYIMSFAGIGILGFVLSSGIKGPFSDIIYWLFNNTILKGMRDSHKFVAMMTLSYSIIGGFGITRLEQIRKGKFRAIVAVFLIIPLIYSFTIFNGFAGQIKSTDYPKDWYKTNNFINNDSQDFKILFFPWHEYMDFKWVNNADKMIANPSRYFFDKEIISGTNIDNRLIYREDKYPDQLYIDFLLNNRNNITNFGNLISILNVKYVILAKDADYKRYEFLFNQYDLELIKETRTLYLFKNMRDISKIYSVDGIAYIKGWNELLERSKTENITDRLYIIGNNSNNISESSRIDIKYEKKNPVDYDLISSNKKYIIFTEVYSDYWKLDNKSPVKAYGVVNAYITDGNNKEIKFERFYKIYIPAYIISLLTFIILVGIYFDIDKSIILRIKK